MGHYNKYSGSCKPTNNEISNRYCLRDICYPLQNSKLVDLYNAYILIENSDISDITYHEIHTNLLLSLYNIECDC